MRHLTNNIFTPGIFKDIDEPVICGNTAIFIQNTYRGSKLAVYNMATGKMDFISMKERLIFNIHADGNSAAFEFSGSRRGIAYFNICKLEIHEIIDDEKGIILGGIWENYIVFRRGNEIVLYDTLEKSERVIANCHHIFASPSIGGGNCIWLQVYKDRCCAVIYDIAGKSSIVYALPGIINKMYVLRDCIVFQSCSNNRCGIYSYDVKRGITRTIFESSEWLELYKGRDNNVAWTVRKIQQDMYTFDIWVYNILSNKMERVVSNNGNAVIPTASGDFILWVDAGSRGDSLCLKPLEF